MATMSHADSRRMYSWWWDSHISPKNSKWLQENLTGMDAKVKAMIKLIEEDADSFARRAEMYYKKRPELMKLVEEFYRAYRALAERYDHATGVIRQAHRTMTEAFPNQIPLVFGDDSPAGSDADPRTPQMSPPVRALLDPDDLQKDALDLSSSHSHTVKRNGAFTDEPDPAVGRKGLKQLNDLFGFGGHAKSAEGRVRKGLNFHHVEEKEQPLQSNENHGFHAPSVSEPGREHVFEKENLTLKEALSKLEAEKEATLAQYQQTLERLSNLDSEISRAQEDSRGLRERASTAEAEVQSLKESLKTVEAEKEASHLQYKQCLDRISTLEDVVSRAQQDNEDLNEQARKAEQEAQYLKNDLSKLEAEKDAALDKYKESLEMISNLQSKLLIAEEDARKFSECANKAESEVETLKHAVVKVTEEKESVALMYQHCLDTISSLEHQIAHAQEETKRLNGEIDDGVKKLKSAEEQCAVLERSNQSLHSELEATVLKMGTQSQELTEKQKELGRLWTCLQEERLRFVEAETAFQTLQHLHSQAQEELRALASELQNSAHILRDMENQNQFLQDEVLKVKEENKNLNGLNLSSAISMNDMQNEIFGLRDTKRKLEEEVELQQDQRNALQQEIYCMKEELNVLNKKHVALLEDVDAVGLNPECLKSSVKELQVENSNLKETCDLERGEKISLMKKLEILELLLEKNALLEASLSKMSADLDGARGIIKSLEETCQSLLEEKSAVSEERDTLKIQLQAASGNLGELSDKNIVLQDSLSAAYDELEVWRAKSTILEDSCQLLVNEKASLSGEKDTLMSQLITAEQRLGGLEITYKLLEEKFSVLEKEKESTLSKVKELQVSLDAEKQKYASFAEVSTTQLIVMETQIHNLEEEGRLRKKEFEHELDNALNSYIEIFVLQRCVQDLKEKNLTLLIQCQKLLETSYLFERTVLKLEQENLEQKVEVQSLSDQAKTLRVGMHQLLQAFNIVPVCEDKIGQDQACLNLILRKLEDTKVSFCLTQDENQQLAVEMSVLITLLEQLTLERQILEMEKLAIDHEFRIMTEQFLALQDEVKKLIDMNEELRSEVREGDDKEKVLTAQVGTLHKKLLDMQEASQDLQNQNSEVLEEKRILMEDLFRLEEKNQSLEEENHAVFGEMLSLSTMSLLLKNYADDRTVELKKFSEDKGKLHLVNRNLEEKLNMTERKLHGIEMENFKLKNKLENSVDELKAVTVVRDQLNIEIANTKNMLTQKEMELLEAEQKLQVIENDKSELHKVVEDLQGLYNKVRIIRDAQEIQIVKQSADIDHLRKEIECITEVNHQLKGEVITLQNERVKTKNREEVFLSDLQKRKDEIDILEVQAVACFGEWQASSICQALFEEKVHELSVVCQSLEDDNTSKDTNVELLKGAVSSLEGENKGLKAQLAAYFPAIDSLRGYITSLENHTYLRTKLLKTNNEELQKAGSETYPHAESHPSQDQNTIAPDALSDLLDLQDRVKDIEEVVLESERLALQENSSVHSKLEAAMRQIEEFKSQSSARRENVKPTSEISEADTGLLTKDIMLDQISECSSYGISRREQAETENQVLELWEAADHHGGIDLTVGKAKKMGSASSGKKFEFRRFDSVKKQNRSPASNFLTEKELGVDKLEISKGLNQSHQEGNKRKVLERLNSDAQKLTNLQITVQDLKRKVQITENSRKGEAIAECDALKGQLGQAEAAIPKLFDLNGKLMKSIEDGSFSSDGKSTTELDENASIARRRILEQARRVSEKIGRLQLEVQKIQFVLLKLDNEKESKGTSRIPESSKRRVLLRDYLYGGLRTNHRRKKANFCACVQPPTKGD